MESKTEKEKFERYVKVQKSGATNMFAVNDVCNLSGLKKEDVMDIMKEYSELAEKYPEVIK